MIKTTRNKKGFSLIEIILALLVVAIGITSLLGLLGSSLDSSSKSKADLHTVSFAEMILNYCHAQTAWDAIRSTGNLVLPDYNGTPTSLTVGSIDTFTLNTGNMQDQEVQYSFPLTYHLDIDDISSTVKRINLKVWPGFSTNAPPRIFYTELYNWADR